MRPSGDERQRSIPRCRASPAAAAATKKNEPELWRGKLYGVSATSMASSVKSIPYQDSDLERLYVFLRHLAAKLPRRHSGRWISVRR